jgi:hypothetical protein
MSITRLTQDSRQCAGKDVIAKIAKADSSIKTYAPLPCLDTAENKWFILGLGGTAKQDGDV